jgi:hypothetical protein
MRVCGAVLAIVAAGLAVRHAVARDPAEDLLGALAVLLAGSVLVTQHWGAAVAVAVLALATVAVRFARRGQRERDSHRHIDFSDE